MTERQLAAKAYMDKYGDACRRVRQCEEQLERENLSVDAIRSASDNDGMPHGSGISKPTEDKAIRLADRALRLTEARLEAIRIRQDVFDLIDSIDGIEGDVLYQRYIKLHKWEEVCVLLHYSWQGIHLIHRRALAIVESRLKCT